MVAPPWFCRPRRSVNCSAEEEDDILENIQSLNYENQFYSIIRKYSMRNSSVNYINY